MNRYTIEDNGKRYVVEAESEEQALSLIAQPAKAADVEAVRRSSLVQGQPSPFETANPMNAFSSPKQKLEAMKQMGPAAAEMAKSTALRGGPAAVGAYAGSSFGPPGTVIGGGIGALVGSVADQLRQGRQVAPGETAMDTAMGMVPGGSLAGAPVRRVAGRMAVDAGLNMGAGAVQTLVDQKRAPTAEELAIYGAGGAAGTLLSRGLDSGRTALAAVQQAGQDSVLQETLKIGKAMAKEIAEDASLKQGYILPPAMVNPNAINRFANSVAGAADTALHAIKHNQKVTNAALRKQFGMSPEEPFTLKRIMELKQKPNAVYERVATVSDESKALLDEYKSLHSQASSLRAQYYNADVKDPELLQRAKNFSELAKTTKRQIAAELQGNPYFNRKQADELMDQFEAAERERARIGLLELAFRPTGGGDGNISAKVLGDVFEHEQDIVDGALYKIGRFENAFKNMLGEAAGRPNPGVNHLGTYLAGGLGFWGASQFGPGGVAVGLAPMFGREGTRQAIMSPPYQRAMVNYRNPAPTEDFIAMFSRIAAQQQSREQSEKAMRSYEKRIQASKKPLARSVIESFSAGLR